MPITSERNTQRAPRIPLLWLLAPSTLAIASWITQAVFKFPAGTTGTGLTALGLVVGVLASVWASLVLLRRLVLMPSTRGVAHCSAFVAAVLTAVPAALMLVALAR